MSTEIVFVDKKKNHDDDKKGHPFKPIYIFNVSKLV